MSRTYRDSNRNGRGKRDRIISVRGVRKDPPDLRKLSRALIQLAMAEADAEAQAKASDNNPSVTPSRPNNSPRDTRSADD